MSFSSGITNYSFVARTLKRHKKLWTTLILENSSRKYNTLSFDLAKNSSVEKVPFTMKISDTHHFHACLTKEILTLKDLFTEHGHEIRIVGGAVRDLLLGNKPEDIDLATTATPQEMKEMLNKKNIRMINNNGEKHGTITARIEEKNFEVTTLRRDIVTDGRHATVEFTKNWFQDASRRDLTVNAMFLDFDGCLIDYFNGYEDLKNRRIRFVGNPSQRIQEDYLRILRYFRFYGKLARDPDNHLEDTITAIRENASGLNNIAGERIAIELYKILNGNFVYEIMSKMIKLNIGRYIGLPEKCDLVELKTVTDRLKKHEVAVKPMTLLAALHKTEEELEQFYSKIKPSTFDRNLGSFIVENRHKLKSSESLKFYQRYILLNKNKPNAKAYALDLMKYRGDVEYLEEIENWDLPKCPVNGNILRSKGVTGKKVGVILTKLTDIWITSDFKLNEEELLERLPDVLKSSEPSHQKQNIDRNELKNFIQYK